MMDVFLLTWTNQYMHGRVIEGAFATESAAREARDKAESHSQCPHVEREWRIDEMPIQGFPEVKHKQDDPCKQALAEWIGFLRALKENSAFSILYTNTNQSHDAERGYSECEMAVRYCPNDLVDKQSERE